MMIPATRRKRRPPLLQPRRRHLDRVYLLADADLLARQEAGLAVVVVVAGGTVTNNHVRCEVVVAAVVVKVGAVVERWVEEAVVGALGAAELRLLFGVDGATVTHLTVTALERGLLTRTHLALRQFQAVEVRVRRLVVDVMVQQVARLVRPHHLLVLPSTALLRQPTATIVRKVLQLVEVLRVHWVLLLL